jgi:CheY-like chemotaxis protein
VLGYHGHRVLEAEDASHGLAVLRSEFPDLVVTDVLLPGMDGYELVRAMREGGATRHIPVIFYTANYLEPETRPLAEAFRVTEVVLRSADPRALLDAVDAALASGPVDVDQMSAESFTRQRNHASGHGLVARRRMVVMPRCRCPHGYQGRRQGRVGRRRRSPLPPPHHPPRQHHPLASNAHPAPP